MSIAEYTRSIGVAVFIGVSCLTAGGCSIFVPHVKPQALPAHDAFRIECAIATGSDVTKPAVSLKKNDPPLTSTEITALETRISESRNAALNSAGGVDPKLLGSRVCGGYIRAEEYRRDYYRAVRLNAGVKKTINALMIPLAGLAAREGFDANPQSAKIEDYSIGGVVLYGWATVLTSGPRQKVYLNGMQAMSCAMIEAQPLMVGAYQLNALNAQAVIVKEKRDAFWQALVDNELSALDQPADTQYLKVLADADNSMGRVADYAVQLADSSGKLLPLVESIAIQVGKNIEDTEPSNESVLALISNFGSQARTLVSSALPPKAAAPLAPQSGGDKRRSHEKAVAPAYLALRKEIDKLNDLLGRVVAVSAVATKLESCRADQVVNEFKVDPADASVVIKVGEVREFTITNKISIPVVSIDGDNADHVERQDMIVRGDSFVVRIKGLTITGDAGPTLVVKDGTGNQVKKIALKVAAASVPATNNTGGQGNAGAGAPAPVAMTDPEKALVRNRGLVNTIDGEDDLSRVKRSVKAMQCVLGISPPTGEVAAATRAKIKELMKDVAGRTPPDVIDKAFLDKIEAALASKPECKQQTP